MTDNTSIIQRTQQRLLGLYQAELNQANAAQLHYALSESIMETIAHVWIDSRRRHTQRRRAYYFSAEYLMGRMVYNNLYCLNLLDQVRTLFSRQSVDIGMLEEIEDAALGNGGLGRLAACFLDSAATHGLPLDGYGLRYKLGLFRQVFDSGMQHELPDDWQRGGDPWSQRREDEAVTISFADGDVQAVPYDMPIIGYQSGHICTLRLWQSEPFKEIDFQLFNDQKYEKALDFKNKAENITRVLYPNDSTKEGKQLRLKQHYLLCSASLIDILRRYKRIHGDSLAGFAAHCAIQLNDTHPTLSIPELIRLLLAHGCSFDEAFETARQVFCYTNHTVMSEALEKWDMTLIENTVPSIADVIRRINEKLMKELSDLGIMADQAEQMCIIDCNGCIHMARLAVYVCRSVNGVAQIHTQILKDSVFKEWHALWPSKFSNKTNGITQRRWLGLCNPELTKLIENRIGTGFLTHLDKINHLKDHIDTDMVCEFNAVKQIKKQQLSDIILAREGVLLPPEFLFDVQIKRLHEYKRQLLCAFSIMHIYFSLKNGSLTDFYPTAFIFGAKAAPGYKRAKTIMCYINAVANLVNTDSKVADKLRVVFVQNYNCSYAEHIIPAADISEQISPAGTEASGTGNMKLMLNGAVTLGTYDGANIEIAQQAGEQNNYIFGSRVEEITRVQETYDPKSMYQNDARIRRVVDTLIDGTLGGNGRAAFSELHDALIEGTDWHQPDHYFVLLDMLPYFAAKLRANQDYADRLLFGRKCLTNIVGAGRFSSDRTVEEYSKDIWQIKT